MPSGVGLELVLVVGLIVLLLVAVVVGRLRRAAAPAVEPETEASNVAPGEGLGGRIRALLSRKPTEDDWRRLEEALLQADAGPTASREIVTRVRERFEPGDDPERLLIEEIAGMFEGDDGLRLADAGLSVLLVVGVNGSGKTTTIGKLAHRLVGQGKLVALAASDTFRAAAVPQLREWGERAGADIVAQERGADPGAVAFDALEAARARGHDVLIVDTAGRLHTRVPLMDELAKVKRVLEKAHGDLQEVLLVLDATTGQNGIAQARAFVQAVGVTGIALTKLDGTARGGVVLAIREELGVPVKLVGTGESVSDLRAFDPHAFARDLV